MDAKTLAAVLGVGIAIGYVVGYFIQEHHIEECDEFASQSDYYGTTTAARAMSFAECLRPKKYRITPKQ